MSQASEKSFADLHLHTNFSDGTFTPEELAARGAKVGLAAMSLTDHDTVEGAERMAAAPKVPVLGAGDPAQPDPESAAGIAAKIIAAGKKARNAA